MARKDVKVGRDHSTTDGTPQAGNNDKVYWQIDKIDKKKEKLGVTSDYWWILPTTFGNLGDDTINVTLTFTPGSTPFNLPYTVQVDNGSRTSVVTSYLVIDTIGNPPPPPPKHHHDHDRDEQGEDGHRHEGRD